MSVLIIVLISCCFLNTFFVEIICISSDSSQAKSCTPPSYAIEETSSESSGWTNYFPKIESPKPFKVSSDRADSSSKVTKEYEDKLAFVTRKKVLGLPAPTKWGDFGIKVWEPKLPNDPKGKGKKRMG